MNRRRPVGDKEGDQFRDFFGATGSAERNSAWRVYEVLPGGLLVGPSLFGEPDDQAMCGRRLNEARSNRIHADTLRPHLLRQPLAISRQRGLGISRQRGLGSGISEGRLEQRQSPLNRRDVNDDARAPLDHLRQQSAVETDSGKQIDIRNDKNRQKSKVLTQR